MADIMHRVGIAASPDKVHNALTTNEGLASWWTTDTSGAGSVGSIIKFRFGGHGPDFEIVEQTDLSIRWNHSGEMPGPWMGTEVSFHLTRGKNQTYLLFSHSNWKEPSDFMAHCSTKWAVFLLSLKEAVETGEGKPYPHDIHIDHDE